MKDAQLMTLIAKISFWFFKFEFELKPVENNTITAIENVFGTADDIKERLADHSKTIRLGAA